MVMTDLPDDVLFKLFTFFSPKDLTQVIQTCKSWQRVASDQHLWKGFLVSDVDAQLPENPESKQNHQLHDYKNIYINKRALRAPEYWTLCDIVYTAADALAKANKTLHHDFVKRIFSPEIIKTALKGRMDIRELVNLSKDELDLVIRAAPLIALGKMQISEALKASYLTTQALLKDLPNYINQRPEPTLSPDILNRNTELTESQKTYLNYLADLINSNFLPLEMALKVIERCKSSTTEPNDSPPVKAKFSKPEVNEYILNDIRLASPFIKEGVFTIDNFINMNLPIEAYRYTRYLGRLVAYDIVPAKECVPIIRTFLQKAELEKAPLMNKSQHYRRLSFS